jgi:NAD(P)-dependent dehydrogenase (short-subunit alcohol dehydrogenase family)
MVACFLAEGANVMGADIREPAAIAVAGPMETFLPLACDVSQSSRVDEMFATFRRRFGRMDIVCNNAGVATMGKRLHETSLEDWDRVMAVNLRGAFWVLKRALEMMLEGGGGVIINTSSTSAMRVREGSGAYSSAKSGLLRLTELAALEYARDNIRVNAICPGPTETAIFAGMPSTEVQAIASSMPMGRLGTARDAAEVCLFLASDDASFVTGAAYLVDGGRVLT